MSTTAPLADGHYSVVLGSKLLETFRKLLMEEKTTINQKEVRMVRGLPPDLSTPFLEAGLLVPTNEDFTFLIFESTRDTLNFAIEKLKIPLPNEEVRFLKRELVCIVDEGNMITNNSHMQKIINVAGHVASTDVPVLILGETGVGKEVLAKFIHEQSNRSKGPFVKVSCAALPSELLESELFGYERGAFTGAIRDHAGKFEQADKGTILLDEIGDMSPHLQAKLLHVLQDGEFCRLGGKKNIRVNIRILAATNKNIGKAVLKGEFRNDLYYRLNVIKFEIPPLRERREDIPLLCQHFVEKYRERYRSEVAKVPQEVVNTFFRYDWPGNIRQLENSIKRFLILPEADISSEIIGPAPEQAQPIQSGALSLKEVSVQAAETAEKEVVLKMLEETGWNRKETARLLRVSYKALRNKIKKWQLTKPASYPKH